MVKTMLSALMVVGLATTASANSVTGAASQAKNAVQNDVSSTGSGVSQISTDAKNMAQASEVYASLKSSTSAVAQRVKAVLSSQQAPVQKGDVEASSQGTTAAPTAVKNDASSAASGTANMTSNTANASTNSQTVALGKAAGKKMGHMSTNGAKAVSASVMKVARAISSGLKSAASYSKNVAVVAKNSSSEGTTNVSNAISLNDSVSRLVATNEGEWNTNRDFNEATALYIEEAKIAADDATFTAQDAQQALEVAVQL
jgi:hypothetical protein